MDRLKMPEGEPIEAGMVTRSIESAQRKVEGRNFDIRKQLLEYDDVANDQRKETYRLRNQILESKDIGDLITNLCEDVFTSIVRNYVPVESMEEQWDIPGLENLLTNEWGIQLDLQEWINNADSVEDEEILAKVIEAAKKNYQAKEDLTGRESFASFERSVMLYSLDSHWREHLAALDRLRQGIHLRGYAQKDPKQEYRREAFELYAELLDVIKNDVIKTVFTVQIKNATELDEATETITEDLGQVKDLQYKHQQIESGQPMPVAQVEHEITPVPVREGPKIGRNDPCHCGSGKKYKHCHGKIA
jgi:preprotein translocase subunit SecA